MSAYIVDDETINQVLGWLNRAQHRQGQYAASRLNSAGYPVDQTDRLEALGQAMYQLNLDAVHGRYPDCETDEDLPGPIGPKEYTFNFGSPMISVHQALKSLECWSYQCAEGDIPERKLYQTMEGVAHDIRGAIIDSLPEYEQAKWA